MAKKQKRMVDEFEDVARAGLRDLKSFFRGENRDELLPVAVLALKAGGQYARLRATEANEAAVAVAAGKYIGVSGEAMAPIFERLTGREALPAADERSGGDTGSATQDQ